MPLYTNANFLAAEAGSCEPQRQNNFTVTFVLNAEQFSMGLQGFTVPKQSNEPVELQYLNEKRKVAGQTSVEEATLVLKDYVDVETRGAVLRWRTLVYDPSTGKIGLAKNYKKHLKVEMYAPDNSSNVRVATLIGCWPISDPAITLSMENGDKVLMEVPISVDRISWAGGGVGANIG